MQRPDRAHYVPMLLESTGADFYIKPQRALVLAR